MAKKATATTLNLKNLGQNIQYELNGDLLTLHIDLSQDFGESKSGKTITVASSRGNVSVGNVKVGVNVYKYKEPKKGKK
jgi:hypothetical protein